MVSRRTKWLRWLVLASMATGLLLPTTSFTSGGVVAQSSAEGRGSGIDLAAIAINPLDLAVLSQPDATLASGQYLDERSASRLIARSYRKPLDDARGIVNGNGFQQGYTLTNEIPESGSAEGTTRLSSTLLVSTTPDTARALYRALTGTPEKGVTVVSDETVVGDDSQIVSYTTDASLDGVITTMQLTTLSGAWVSLVSVSAHDLPSDARDLVEATGNELLRKATLIRNGESPRISYQALTLRDVDPALAAYVGSAGVALPVSGESDGSLGDREARYADVTITYREEMDIPSDLPGIQLAIEISGFQYFDAAAGWVNSAADRQRRISGSTDVDVDYDLDALGDASTSITYRTDDGRQVRQVSVLTGPYTVTIDLAGQDLPPASVLEDFARAQLRCLQAEAVCAAIAIPSELSPAEPTVAPGPTFPPPPPAAATPVVEVASPTATVTPRPSPTATTISSPAPSDPISSLSTPETTTKELSYTDPDYPFAIAYSPDRWQIDDQGTTNNRNFVLFGNGTSQIYLIAGVSYGADTALCLQDAANGLEREAGVTGVAPAVNRDGEPVAGSSGTDAFAVYTYTRQDGAPMARYLKCMVLEPERSTLLILQIVPAPSFNDEIGPRTDLLDGLEISAPVDPM